MPKWYRERPAAARGDDFYMRAFWELSTTRSYGYAIGPIPWHRIVQYGFHSGLDADMIAVLEVVVREMDEAWLEWQREEQKRRTERTRGRKPKVKRPR